MDVRGLRLPDGRVALVSGEDLSRVASMNWSTNARGYVRARWRQALGGHGGIVYLHRFIMAAPEGMVVDHIDGNPLNNSRDNLQITTTARNVMRARGGGVTFDRHLGKWRVRKRVDGRMANFGLFDCREDAEVALAAAMREIWSNPEVNKLGTVL